MKKLFLLLFSVNSISLSILAQDVYPTHWWVGMKNSSLSLLFRGDGIGQVKTVTTSYPGITVKKITSF